MNLRPNPWGGSNQFGVPLISYLREKGKNVSVDLTDPGIDLIYWYNYAKICQFQTFLMLKYHGIYVFETKNPWLCIGSMNMVKERARLASTTVL
jgi:hypothetical protein